MERVTRERGAALIMILLFTALMFILVTTMLTTGGNEILISGLHRDGVRALDHAEAGLRDAISRMMGGRTWKIATPPQPAPTPCQQRDGTVGFRSSLEPIPPNPREDTCVAVIEQAAGASASFLEVRSESRVGLARRRISALVLAAEQLMPPDIFFGFSLSESGSANITGGDSYSRTYVKYKSMPSDPQTLTYSGWGISKSSGGSPNWSVDWCYTHAECEALQSTKPGVEKWFPGHRRASFEDMPINQTISPQPMGTPADTRVLSAILNYDCAGIRAARTPQPPAGEDFALQPNEGPQTLSTTIGSWPQTAYNYGGVTDRRADRSPADPLQSTLSNEPLYGCSGDDLPYTWVREAFDSDDPGTAVDKYMWFKTIRYEQWFSKYWVLDPVKLEYRKRGVDANGNCDPNVVDNLCDPARWKYGAVPQFPPIESLVASADQKQSGGGTISASSTLDFGYCANPLPASPPCTDPASRRTVVLLDNGNYKINKNITDGHGITVVRGDLEVNGTFTYYGLLIVEGTLTLGAGNVTVVGGVVAKETAELNGTITVQAGVLVPNARVGPLSILSNVWWER